MKKARAAALSAAGLMLVAGCSGGRSAGTSLPAPLASSTAIALAKAAKVTLSLSIPARQTLAFRRGPANVRPAGATRKPNYISPSTYYISLNAVYGGASIYSTYFSLAQCTTAYGVYECTTNLPYGTFTLYTNLYDQQGQLLSTNMYSNPAAVTVYPNGSPYDNYLYVQTAGVVYSLQTETPNDCFAAGYQQSIPLLFLDADGNTIVGPLANPFTATFTAYNGAGLGAIAPYAIYNGAPVAMNNVTVYDSSIYSSPYFFVSGAEGAVNVAATIANIPINTGGSSTLTYSASGGIAATGTYIAWGIQNAPYYGLYMLAIEQSLNQIVLCGNGPVLDEQFTYVGSILSPTNPYIVANDVNGNFWIFDASFTTNYTYSAVSFQSGSSYGAPGPRFNPYVTAQFTPSSPIEDFFTSANVTGRIDVLVDGTPFNVVQVIDTSSGSITSSSAYSAYAGITFASNTKVVGSPTAGALYYDVPGTPYLYGIYTAGGPPGSAFPAIDFSMASPAKITSQIFALAPSGSGSPATQFVRGVDTSGNYYICAFDATNFANGIYCHSTSSHNSNPASMQYDPLTGSLMWASGSYPVYAFPAHGVQPSTFINTTFPGTGTAYTLSHTAFRLVPGLEGVPGVAGFYGGQMTSGSCTGSGEITWLQWNGSNWAYLTHTCWPNHYITLTYP